MCTDNQMCIRDRFIAILGGLLFGYDTAVISGAEQALQKHLGLAAFWHGVTASSALREMCIRDRPTPCNIVSSMVLINSLLGLAPIRFIFISNRK